MRIHVILKRSVIKSRLITSFTYLTDDDGNFLIDDNGNYLIE